MEFLPFIGFVSVIIGVVVWLRKERDDKPEPKATVSSPGRKIIRHDDLDVSGRPR